MFTNDPITIWSLCVRKWFLFPIHAGLLTIIRKRLQGKRFTSSIHFNHYFWLTGEFQKYQTKVSHFAPCLGGPTAECFQLQGAKPRWPPDQGLCPWTPLGALPPDPRYRLALRARHESYSHILFTPVFSTWRRPWTQPTLLCARFTGVAQKADAEQFLWLCDWLGRASYCDVRGSISRHYFGCWFSMYT